VVRLARWLSESAAAASIAAVALLSDTNTVGYKEHALAEFSSNWLLFMDLFHST